MSKFEKKTHFYLDQGYDEAELEKELEDLEQQELDNELLGVNANAHELPDVPVDNITVPIAANKDKKGKYSHSITILNVVNQFILQYAKFQY